VKQLLSLLFLLINILSCSNKNITTMANTSDKKTITYLAIGDSYTIGEQVPAKDNFPNQVYSLMKKEYPEFAEPRIIAKTGWTTAELTKGVEQANPQGPYDLVSLLIGVNNQYRGLSQDDYRDEFVELLETAVSLANNNANRVFVVSIPDWGVTPFGHNRDFREVSSAIDAFNAINRAETELRGILYIDITETSRRVPADNSLVAEDGLHPSGEMYRLWVELMQPTVCRRLAQN
jgi:lysophospholipase L1-like esterase